MEAWFKICEAMRSAGTLNSSAKKVIFTTGGRPIYHSGGTSSNKKKINAPRSMLSIVAYLQPIDKNAAGQYVRHGTSTVVTTARGMIIWSDYHQTTGWAYAPSGGAYTGALVGDDEDCVEWNPSFRDYSI